MVLEKREFPPESGNVDTYHGGRYPWLFNML